MRLKGGSKYGWITKVSNTRSCGGVPTQSHLRTQEASIIACNRSEKLGPPAKKQLMCIWKAWQQGRASKDTLYNTHLVICILLLLFDILLLHIKRSSCHHSIVYLANMIWHDP